jgi:hypothetical protein
MYLSMHVRAPVFLKFSLVYPLGMEPRKRKVDKDVLDLPVTKRQAAELIALLVLRQKRLLTIENKEEPRAKR